MDFLFCQIREFAHILNIQIQKTLYARRLNIEGFPRLLDVTKTKTKTKRNNVVYRISSKEVAMENSFIQFLNSLLKDGLTRYEIIPFIVVLGLLVYSEYVRKK